VNKTIKLSATRINTFLQCKQRYWFSYEEKFEKLSNPVFKLGLACHDTLERAGKLWKDSNLNKFTSKQIESLLLYYDECSVKHGVEDYTDHLTGRDIIKSKLTQFKIGERIVGIEDRFGFENTQVITTSGGVELIGAIDKAVEIDENTLAIIDYKTSKTVPDADKLRSDIQLSMYNLVARKLYPQYKKIILCLDMLRSGELVYTYRTQEELDNFEHYLTEVHKQMCELTKENAKPSINFLCAWCDHTNVCEKYQELCLKKEYTFLNVNSLSDNDLIEEWENVKTVQKILELRQSEIADVLISKLKLQEHPVISGDKEIVLRQRSKTSYNALKLSNYVSFEDFASLVSVSSTKLKKYVEKNPSILPIMNDISETNFSGAFLATKKIKQTK
jgi:RecB family exonuclease